MPPKTSTKAETKAKQKILEDKTFGLKNKNKSAKVGKYINSLENTLKQGGNRRKDEDDARLAKERKKQEEAKKAELAALFKPVVQQQKVALGVDPKSIVCAFFKQGLCQKGDKCKFSHDMAVERKSAKINMYEDNRDDLSTGGGGMENWDQEKLTEVIARKHQNVPGVRTTTDLVCRHFLEAIETRKYGWFWECPNGNEKCKYRHALPPDFVLKPRVGEGAEGNAIGDDETEQISLEEFLDSERHKIQKGTPVTAESFAKWKADRKERQELETLAKERSKEADIRAGKLLNLSGRDLFTYNPEIYAISEGEDEGEEALDVGQHTKDSEEEDVDIQDESVFLDEELENLEIDE